MSNIKKKIKIRQGHRAYLTKILGNADDNVQNYDGNTIQYTFIVPICYNTTRFVRRINYNESMVLAS